MAETTIKIGPAGNDSGERWDQKGRTKIHQIFISYGGSEGIISIQFQYYEQGGLTLSERFGSLEPRSPGFATVMLHYHDEFITGVEGYWDTCIKELTIHTNKKSCGPFGKAVDVSASHKFKLDIGTKNEFGGFHGTHDPQCVKSIGMYMRPTQYALSMLESVHTTTKKEEFAPSLKKLSTEQQRNSNREAT